ncbi:MAG: multiheme c-type cytochrome, partial [bacterium]
MINSKKILLTMCSIIVLVSLGPSLQGDKPSRLTFLPGTQPGEVLSFESYTQCQNCHQTQASGFPVTITADWHGSPMANAARDPFFYAATAIANKYVTGAGEYCIRCHSPTGWLEQHYTPPTGESLTGNDLNGVQCDFCHRMKDPVLPDSSSNPQVPGYGNGMFRVQTARTPKRGPYTDAVATFHTVQADTFYRTGEFCGVCHNVSNPMYATDPITQSPHLYGEIERTYSEWKLSWYAQQGRAGTCQACHMQAQQGYGANLAPTPQRPDIAKHDLTGGNAFLPDILPDFWQTGIDTTRLRSGKQRVIQTLQSAATLGAFAYRRSDTVTVRVQITNLTGHKLPTGYPEGRRMWLNIVGRNTNGDTVVQSGAYNFQTADLTHDAQAKIYETKPGLTPARAIQYGVPAGPSFHFILNDTTYFDNRIPPRGFANAAFASHRAAPVAYAYADGQYWDVSTYKLPAAVTNVSATLYYQTTSKEYITYLRDQNVGNTYDWKHWGDSLYASWNRRGKSTPVVMNTQTVTVVDSSTGVSLDNVPLQVSLLQNYPNPFNPSTKIVFRVASSGSVSLKVFDLLGREVAILVNERLQQGEHTASFNAENFP